METLHKLSDPLILKTLADERRLRILRLLMEKPATLTHLGAALGQHPAKIRHHLKLLENAGLVILVEERQVRGFMEKYYQASAGAYSLETIVLPAGADGEMSLRVMGSHDLALEALAQHLVSRKESRLKVFMLPLGSLEGLIALRHGYAQVAGCHLLDVNSGEYNLPYIRHLFPDMPIAVFTLAHRQQGLLLAPGNPKGIRSLDDLSRQDVRLVNRNPGSGTRLWLDSQLARLGIPFQRVNGYDSVVQTHTAVARAVQQRQADCGIAILEAAQRYNLDFIPLFEERFDLAIRKETLDHPGVQIILEFLQDKDFRQVISPLRGYQISHSGEHHEVLPFP